MTPIHCERPGCLAPASGYIPLPNGLNRNTVFLCTEHLVAAQQACYYTCSFTSGPEPEEAFLRRVNNKHQLLRGSASLLYTPRHAH